jgi:diguanylate cyclase (GGDEF)-like protein
LVGIGILGDGEPLYDLRRHLSILREIGYPQAVNDVDRGPARILIADDVPDLLDALKETLEREGYAVEAVGDGASALALIRANPPDIAVLDLKMPRLTGFEVCRALRDDPLLENLPVVILSASGSRESKIEGLDLGADDFITKPVDVRELLARIRMILKRTRQGLDANPLTRLPGNLSIESRIDRALAEKRALAVLYVDLNQFKAYNDAYGYDAGDRVLKSLARVLVDQVRAGGPADFIGHIGGDDFIALSTPDRMEDAARRICAEFDAVVPSFYSEEDRARGTIAAKDRLGVVREFPLLSVAIGICHNRDRALKNFAQIATLGAELKKAAKAKTGSAFVLDRRKD